MNDQTILQQELDCLHNWAVRLGMTCNPSKCYIMHITRGAQTGQVSSDVWDNPGHCHAGKVPRNYRQLRSPLAPTEQPGCQESQHHIAYDISQPEVLPTQDMNFSILHTSTPEAGMLHEHVDPFQQQDKDTLERINRLVTRVVYNKTWRERGVSPTALLKDLGWDPLSDCR